MFANKSLEVHISQKDMGLWALALKHIMNAFAVREAATKPHPGTINCHTICRAVGRCVPELKVLDGWYLGVEPPIQFDGRQVLIGNIRRCAHSWLLTPDGTIIDPYPVGFVITNPILIPAKGDYRFFGYDLYVPDPKVWEIAQLDDPHASECIAWIFERIKGIKK